MGDDGDMRIYSDYAGHRARQILADILAVAGIWFVVKIARDLGDSINGFKQFGVQMAEAGVGFESTMSDIGSTLTGVPLIGDGISAPFAAAAAAGALLEEAGLEQQMAVGELATTVALSVSVLPLLAITLIWLVPRVRFAIGAHRTSKLARSPQALDLLALRAIVSKDPALVLAAVSDPAEAWRTQDRDAIRALAAVELRGTGVMLRADT